MVGFLNLPIISVFVRSPDGLPGDLCPLLTRLFPQSQKEDKSGRTSSETDGLSPTPAPLLSFPQKMCFFFFFFTAPNLHFDASDEMRLTNRGAELPYLAATWAGRHQNIRAPPPPHPPSGFTRSIQHKGGGTRSQLHLETKSLRRSRNSQSSRKYRLPSFSELCDSCCDPPPHPAAPPVYKKASI